MSIYVSGTCDGAFLAVERVHLKTPPSGAVRVLRHPEPGRRKPRAGDRLEYRAPTDAPPFVFAPMCAKRGTKPRGKGMRVYLGNEDAELLKALAKAAGCKPGEIVARFVNAASAALWAMSDPALTVSVASGGAAGSALCVNPAPGVSNG